MDLILRFKLIDYIGYLVSYILRNINHINEELVNFSHKLNLKQPVTLVIVSKGRSIYEIEEAILSGGSHFAENYLQEALSKWSILKKKYPKIKLHFIGGIQSNKLKKILELFDVIQSIDKKSLVDKALNFGEIHNKEFFVEVKSDFNTKLNNRKGIDFNNAQSLINYALEKGLNIKGIMGIAALSNLDNTINYFKLLKALKDSNSLLELSMGMSNDYKLAVQYGSTMVRIGSKIFNKVF